MHFETMHQTAISQTSLFFCMRRDNPGVSKEADFSEDRRTEVVT